VRCTVSTNLSDSALTFRVSSGALYSEFSHADDFAATEQYARETGVLLWSDSRSRRMSVTEEGHRAVKRWRRER